MIEVENLTKYYGPRRAVENVSFKVEKGEILGLLGPNGAGKTTIMRMLTGFFQPTSGKAKVAGFDTVEEPLEVKKRIGYLPETLPLYNEMTVSLYLEYVAKLKGIESKEIKKKVAKSIGMAKISEVESRIIGRLSRGYRQRVGLAQALLTDPEVLILDEPTIGLDPKQIIEIRELIKSFSGEKTVILSSHILPEVSMTCEKIVIIDKGNVVAVDTQEQLSKRLKEGGEKIFVKIKGQENDVIKQISQIKGIKDLQKELEEGGIVALSLESEGDKDIREEIFKTVVSNNWILYEMKAEHMSLEDVFLKLTTKEQEV
ncbi:MAG: ABC transporter ATP-binding protein [Candidatus Firestonebacteria bacterium]